MIITKAFLQEADNLDSDKDIELIWKADSWGDQYRTI